MTFRFVKTDFISIDILHLAIWHERLHLLQLEVNVLLLHAEALLDCLQQILDVLVLLVIIEVVAHDS